MGTYMLDNTLLLIRSQEIPLIFSHTFSSLLIRKFFLSGWSESHKDWEATVSTHKGATCFCSDLQISRTGSHTEMLVLDLTMGVLQRSHGLWLETRQSWVQPCHSCLQSLNHLEPQQMHAQRIMGRQKEHSCRSVTILYCRATSPIIFFSFQKCPASNCFCVIGSGTTPINLWNANMKLYLHNLGILISKILHLKESYCQ